MRKIEVQFIGDAASLERAAARAGIALKAVDAQTTTGGRNWLSWSNALKYAVPAIAGVGVAVLGLTGNMAALAPIIPAVTVFLGAMLAPLTSLLAIMVALTGPIMLLTGLLGILGGAFALTAVKAFGMHKDGLGQAVAGLKNQFETLVSTLVGRFMPVFRFLISSASDLLGYFNKIAKMPLAQAFHSLATTGVQGLAKFLEKVGHIIAKPIRLAFRFAFGGPGQGVDNALGKIWNQIIAFFSKAPKGGQSIDSMVAAWFGRHDFTKTGMRWGMELAGGVVKAFGTGIQHLLMSTGGKMIGGGAIVGGLVGAFTPVGPLAGAAIGAGIGATLNHYWPRIKAAAISAWHTISTSAVKVFHQVTTAIEHFLGPATWNRIGNIAKNVWTIIRTVAVATFHAIVAAGRMLWQIFDTLIIKSGLWKVALALVKGAIYIVVGVIDIVVSVLKTVVGWVVRLGNFVGGNVVSAFNSVLGVINSIIGGIKSAIGWAQSLANILLSVAGQQTGPGATTPRHGRVPGNVPPPHQGPTIAGTASMMAAARANAGTAVDARPIIVNVDGQKLFTIMRGRAIRQGAMTGQPVFRGLA